MPNNNRNQTKPKTPRTGGVNPMLPRASKRRAQRQRPSGPRAKPIDGDIPFSSFNVSEPLDPIRVPSDSSFGTRLYVEECNPARLGEILRAQASQAQSWRGSYEFKLRVNGSVNAKNYAIARWLPDADITKLPTNPERLWKYVRGTAQDDDRPDRAFVKYNIVSEQNRNSSYKVKASWSGTFNPKKPIQDTDPSERSLGLFVIVSNGPPGEDITIDVDVHARGHFYGPTPSPTLIDSSARITATPASLAQPFGVNTDIQGTASVQAAGNVLTIGNPGTFLVTIRYIGTAITQVPTIVFNGVSPDTPLAGAITISATSATDVFRITVPSSGTMTFGAINATTFTAITVRLAPYTAPA